MAVMAPDFVAVLQLEPDLVVQLDLVALLPQEEDLATLTDETEKSTSSELSKSISIIFFSVGINLTCLGGLPGVFIPLSFLEESGTSLACADLDLGLPTFEE